MGYYDDYDDEDVDLEDLDTDDEDFDDDYDENDYYYREDSGYTEFDEEKFFACGKRNWAKACGMTEEEFDATFGYKDDDDYDEDYDEDY